MIKCMVCQAKHTVSKLYEMQNHGSVIIFHKKKEKMSTVY